MATPKRTDDEGSKPAAPGPPSGIERRSYPRIPVELEVNYRAAETFLFAYITDISAMGIFIRTSNPETPGTRLTLHFTPPGNERFELEGEVVWINPAVPGAQEGRNPGMGIQFINLDQAMRERMIALVRTIAYLKDPQDDAASRQ
ncbi:MAG TPA: TIGR02266 family protein [Polyangia bacterium]|nr:TIGR02266 family protein [Polyangia bacterium]